MITYQVVQPFFYSLSANTVNEAIKNFVKIHHDLNLNNIIITDQTNHYKANFKYFLEDGRNRVGINTYPYSGPIVVGPAYSTFINDTLPGATGIPISPVVASNIWSSDYPIVPYANTPIAYVPSIIDINLR